MKQSWQDFALAEPELSAFGESRLKSGPAYLATVRADGMPRVHPVTPILGEGHLLLFILPKAMISSVAQAMRCIVGYAAMMAAMENFGSLGMLISLIIRLCESLLLPMGISRRITTFYSS